MLEPKCRLTIADKFYDMGGPSAVTRSFSGELGQLPQAWQAAQKGYRGFRRSDPLLRGAYQRAEELAEEEASPLLTELQGQALEDVQRRGALSPQEERLVRERSGAAAGRYGTGHTMQDIAREFLNRDVYRQQREEGARRFGMGVEGLGQANIQQRTSLPLQTLQTGQQAYSGLVNPMTAWASDLFNTNANAQNAANIASANKTSDLIGGVLSSVGSVAGAAAMSDERVKEGIKDTGEKTPEGIPIKTFRYKGMGNQRWKGVMAQDVEKIKPEAVRTMPMTGHKLVNFFEINAPFHPIGGKA
jgi:hypothetical protein